MSSEYKFDILFSIIISLSLNETYSSAKKFLVTLNEYNKYKNYIVVIINLKINIKDTKTKIIVQYNKEIKLRVSKSIKKRLNVNSQRINCFFKVFENFKVLTSKKKPLKKRKRKINTQDNKNEQVEQENREKREKREEREKTKNKDN